MTLLEPFFKNDKINAPFIHKKNHPVMCPDCKETCRYRGIKKPYQDSKVSPW